MPINLKAVLGNATQPEKEVYFSRDLASDTLIRVDEAKDSVGMVKIRYMNSKRLQDIHEKIPKRQVVKPSKFVKGLVNNEEAFSIAVCQECVIGWNLTGKSLRALHIQAIEVDEKEELAFNQENVKLLSSPKVAEFATFVIGVIVDYEFWFGASQETEEGN